jgi:GTPase
MFKTKRNKSQLEIDLTGPQGNAFYILGVANKLSKQLGLDSEEIHNEMTSGNYENLLEVFEKYFGDHVIMYR